jgi:hypothetical protein
MGDAFVILAGARVTKLRQLTGMDRISRIRKKW